MNEALLACLSHKIAEEFCGAIVGEIIYHDDVVVEGGLLRKGTAYSIGNGAHTVANGDDDRSLNGEVLLVEVGT